MGQQLKQKPLDQVKVTFCLEERTLNLEQQEAGKRLFSRLIERARQSIENSNEQKNR